MFGKRTEGSAVKPALPQAPQPAMPAALSAPAAAIPDLGMPPATAGFGAQSPRAAAPQTSLPAGQPEPRKAEPAFNNRRSENYYDIKGTIFNALIDAIDLTQLGQLDRDAARDEIRDIVNDAARFAQDAPEPDPSELWTDVLAEA